MEFKLELMVRDLLSLSHALGNGTYVKDIKYVDEDKKEGIDMLRVVIGADNAQAAFGLGMRYQQKMQPLTEEELSAMESRYEYEHDL